MASTATKKSVAPKLRFPAFKTAPKWEKKTVGEIFKITRGSNISLSLFHENSSVEFPYPVYSSQTKNNGVLGYYSEYMYENAITWTMVGANVGDVNYRLGKFYCTTNCGILINKKGYSNPCIATLLNKVANKYVTPAGISMIASSTIEQISIPFPLIKEQQKISDFLISIDALIASQEKTIKILKNHKKSLMKNISLFNNKSKVKHRFPKFTQPYRQVSFGDVLSYEAPTPYIVHSTKYDDSHKTPVLTAGKTFVLGYTNETFGLFDRNLPVIIFDDFTTASKFVDFPFKVKSKAIKILKAKKGIACAKYVYEIMQFIKYPMQAHKYYYISEYQNIQIKIPPFEEQQKISACASSADSLIAAHEKKLQLLNKQKKGLIQQLFPSIEDY